MTGTYSISASSEPLPVLPLERSPQLSYRFGREKLPPMVRIGGVIGFLSVALGVLLLPIHQNPNVGEDYAKYVHLFVPTLQLIGPGSALTLIIVGRLLANAKPTLGFVLALAFCLLTIFIAGTEMQEDGRPHRMQPRWISINNCAV